MSVESMATGDTVFVNTKTHSVGTIGGNTGSWNADSGDGIDCRVEQLDAEEDLMAAAQGQRITHRVYFATDRSLTNTTRLHWTKTNGNSLTIDRYLKVEDYYWENSPDGSLLMYIADCVYQSTARRA